ncbi:MAG: hypothetical protein EBQ99_02150 [Planctomycetes bacterium]|nr:hypothetical protein [Planctomycetota bacterium]
MATTAGLATSLPLRGASLEFTGATMFNLPWLALRPVGARAEAGAMCVRWFQMPFGFCSYPIHFGSSTFRSVLFRVPIRRSSLVMQSTIARIRCLFSDTFPRVRKSSLNQ